MKKWIVLLLLICIALTWYVSRSVDSSVAAVRTSASVAAPRKTAMRDVEHRTEQLPNVISDLPLSEVPASSGGDTLALFITGDGGWAELDQHVSAELARAGIPVIGLSSLKYFWRARTPEGAARDTTDVLRHYLRSWHRKRILLIGYSFGADVLPFIVNRLPSDLRARVISVSLLGLSANATFEVSAAALLHTSSTPSMPVAREISRMGSARVLCVYGKDEKESLCPSLPTGSVTSVRIGVGHHFSGQYSELAQAIVGFAHLHDESDGADDAPAGRA